MKTSGKLFIFWLLVLQLFHTTVLLSQNKQDVNIDYMLPGQCIVKSSIVDTFALGGFGPSDNSAQKLMPEHQFEGNGLLLKIDVSEIVSYEAQYNGYNFFIVNQSDTLMQFEASDSRLDIIAEASFKNKWRPIEYLPNSWCGNSYHYVYLKPDEYWTVSIPKFTGKKKAKIRYRLQLDDNTYVYSNEIEATINRKQLRKKRKYRPLGIMDPYIS